MENKKNEVNIKKFPEKKDFWYCVAILTLIIILLTSVILFDYKDFSNKLELASTLTSIILSVIAIIFSLVESSNSKEINSTIFRSVNQIQCTTKDLSDVSNNIKNMSNSLNEKINHLNKNVIDLHNKVEGNTSNQNNPEVNKDSEITNDSFNKDEVVRYIYNNLQEDFYRIHEIICLLYYIKKNNLKLYPTFNVYFQNRQNEYPNLYGSIDRYNTVLGILSHMQVINWDPKSGEINIYSHLLLDDLYNKIDNRLKQAINSNLHKYGILK